MGDDEAAAKTKKPIDTMIFRVTRERAFIALIAVLSVFLLVRSGLGVAEKAETETTNFNNWGFHIGVVTILFGVLFVALGFPILVNLLLKLSEQLLEHDERTMYPGLVRSGGEMRPVQLIIGRIFVTLITMAVLVWACYTGYRLVTEPKRDDKYYPLIFPIGVVTMAFGTVYILIGLVLIADLTLPLAAQYVLRKKKGIIAQQDYDTETKSFV